MGANVSNQNTEILTKTVNDVLTQITTSFVNSTNTDAYSRQQVDVDLSFATLTGCPVQIDQSARIASSALADTNSKIDLELQNQLLNKVKDQISQQVDQVNQGLNLGQANIANVKAKLDTYAKNNLQNIITSSISNVVSSRAGQEQIVFIHA